MGIMCYGKSCGLAQVVFGVDGLWKHDGHVISKDRRRADMRIAHVRESEKDLRIDSG